jgi:NAD-dependent DNA ligase
MDGVIVTHNKLYKRTNKNPEYAFAFKMVLSDQTAETFVVDVIWSPSKDGYLKPRIRVDPVQVGGVTIEYTTGFNGAFIRDNKIGVGAKVKLIRSGDVIPYIEEVIDPALQAKMPPEGSYEWTESNIDIILKDYTSDDTVKAKNIEIFFKLMEVPEIGKGIATKLIEAKFDTPQKVLKMTKADFLTVDGFKEKKADKIYSNIQNIIYNHKDKTPEQIKVQLIRLMAASNLLGRGIAVKTIKSILDMYPDIITSKETQQEKIAKCIKVKGVAEKTCRPFVENIPKVLEFIETANLTHYLSSLQQSSSSTTMQSKVLTKPPHVMTGFRSKELEEFLESQNIPLGSTINKKTQVVYINSLDYSNSKTDKAKELNIPIIVYTTTQELAKQLKQLKIPITA